MRFHPRATEGLDFMRRRKSKPLWTDVDPSLRADSNWRFCETIVDVGILARVIHPTKAEGEALEAAIAVRGLVVLAVAPAALICAFS